MKVLLILLALFISFGTLNAQEKRTSITGKTVLESTSVVDVHIINKNTKIGAITNDNGIFEIPVKLGDSLFISHINLEDKLILITDKVLKNKNLTINLNEKTITLKGFTFKKPRSIFYVDKEITEYKGPVVNAKTLNLPYANTAAKKDKSIFKISSPK